MKGCRARVYVNGLRTLNFQVHYYGILPTPYDNGLALFLRKRVDLLVWHEGRHIDEIAWACFAAELQVISPSHTGSTAYDVENGLEFPVVMRSGLGVWLNHDGPGPEL